jgi:hypothetical protein
VLPYSTSHDSVVFDVVIVSFVCRDAPLTLYDSSTGVVLYREHLIRHNRRLLGADGDAGCRALIATLFARVGYSTCEAATGHEALALAQESHPGLVLLDVDLPGDRGLRDQHGENCPSSSSPGRGSSRSIGSPAS